MPATPALLPLAEQNLEKALALNPTYPVLANLAALSMQQGKYAQAVDYSKQALKVSDKDYVVWDNLRLASLALGDSAQANAAMSKELVSARVRSQRRLPGRMGPGPHG